MKNWGLISALWPTLLEGILAGSITLALFSGVNPEVVCCLLIGCRSLR